MNRVPSVVVRSFMIFIAVLCFMGGLRGQRHRTTPKEFSIEDPKYNSMIVASVGPHKITAQEFLLNYEFGPAFPKREQDSKLRYLNYMIYEKLLALEGYSRRVDTTAEVRRVLAEVTGDLATEELYKEDILKHAAVSGHAVQAGMRKDRITLSVRWLYTRTEEGMIRLKQLLRSGVSFDTLFAAQLRDSVTNDDRSMEITRFRIGLKNPFLAGVLDTLHAGTSSAILHPTDGYYILQLTNRSEAPLMTESETMKSREDVERALVQHVADSLSDRYVGKIMQGQHPTIIHKAIDLLHIHLAHKILPPQTFSAWQLYERLVKRWGPVDYNNLDGAQALVELKNATYTVKDFLNWYSAREENLHLNSSSSELFFNSLEQLVWRMVRDKLLTERAFKRGYEKKDVVQKQVQWWKDKIVYRSVREGFRDSVKMNEDTLRAYYAKNQKAFKDADGKPRSFEQAKDDVAKALYDEEFTKRAIHKILKLKVIYPVAINDKVLNGLYVDAENQPRAIDVYIAKTGGIFPRPAFPVIDYEWQAWN